MKICTKCKTPKDLNQFGKETRKKDGLTSQCKDCIKEKQLPYRLQNSFKKSLYDIEYRKANKEKIALFKKNWEKKHKNDPIFKIKRNLRRRIHKVLCGQNKSDSTFNLLGCTPEFFKNYLESQFTSEMSWSNYGSYWHIDHIKPCCNFNLLLEEEQRKCFHYTNQRPLEAILNLKRKKYEKEYNT